jgi:hypothetical protein
MPASPQAGAAADGSRTDSGVGERGERVRPVGSGSQRVQHAAVEAEEGCGGRARLSRRTELSRSLVREQVFDVQRAMEYADNLNPAGDRHIEDEVGSKARHTGLAHGFETRDTRIVRSPRERLPGQTVAGVIDCRVVALGLCRLPELLQQIQARLRAVRERWPHFSGLPSFARAASFEFIPESWCRRQRLAGVEPLQEEIVQAFLGTPLPILADQFAYVLRGRTVASLGLRLDVFLEPPAGARRSWRSWIYGTLLAETVSYCRYCSKDALGGTLPISGSTGCYRLLLSSDTSHAPRSMDLLQKRRQADSQRRGTCRPHRR